MSDAKLVTQFAQGGYFQNAATANGNGRAIDTSGINGQILVEITEKGGGTATVSFEGTLSNPAYGDSGPTDAIPIRYVDTSVLPVAIANGNVSVLANTRKTYQLLDGYPTMRARLSSVAGGGNVTIRFYLQPG